MPEKKKGIQKKLGKLEKRCASKNHADETRRNNEEVINYCKNYVYEDENNYRPAANYCCVNKLTMS